MPQNRDDVYVPLFCPNCETNLNPVEDLDDAPFQSRRDDVSCGWCKQRHSIDKVKECRRLGRASERVALASAAERVLELRARLVA